MLVQEWQVMEPPQLDTDLKLEENVLLVVYKAKEQRTKQEKAINRINMQLI